MAATLLGGAIAVLAVASGLVVQTKTKLLYGLDATYVGYSVIVLISMCHSALPRQPLFFRAVGLRVETPSGQSPTLPVRLARVFVFWLIVAAQILPYDTIIKRFPFDLRQRIVASLALAVALIAQPAVTVLFSNGRRGLHDILCGTVVRSPEDPSAAHDSRNLLALRFAIVTASLTVALAMLAISALDWRLRIAENVMPVLRHRLPIASEIARREGADSRALSDIMVESAPRDVYWNEARTAYMLGPVESFRFHVIAGSLANPARRTALVAQAMNAVLRHVALSTRLIAIELYETREFGPALYDFGQTYIYDRRRHKLTYAPTRQEFIRNRHRVSLAEWLRHAENADSSITYFEPKLSRSVMWSGAGWRFPSLDFTVPPAPPKDRFVGRM